MYLTAALTVVKCLFYHFIKDRIISRAFFSGLSVLSCRGIQIPGSRSPWRLNFVRLLQMLVVSMKLVPYRHCDIYNFEVCPRDFFFNLRIPDYGTRLDTLCGVCKPRIQNQQYLWTFFSENFLYLFFTEINLKL